MEDEQTTEPATEPAETPVTYLADERSQAAQEILERIAVAAAAKTCPIRVRVGVQLLDPTTNQYVVWRGQAWRFDMADQSDVEQAREGLELFFDLLARIGAKRVVTELGTLLRA